MQERQIGTLALLMIGVGSIIGSGWLFGSFFAVKIAGPAAIFSWGIAAVLMMVVALIFAELSSAFPMMGGSVRFMQLSHGSLASFGIAWIAWVASIAVTPIEVIAMLHYANNYLPGLMHKVGAVEVLTLRGFEVAAGLMFLLSIINVLGVQFLAKTNTIITFFKLIVPILTVIVLLSVDFHINNFVSQGFSPFGFKSLLMALPAAGIVFSFIGFNSAVQLATEVKNPQRSLPIAILGALGICAVLYMAIQIAFIGALPAADFSQGWQNLSFTHDSGPFAGIALAIGMGWLAVTLYVDAIISPFGTGLVYAGNSVRLGYAMGKNNYFFSWFMPLNHRGIPWRIVWLNYGISLILLLPFPTWQRLVGFLVSSFVLSYSAAPLSLVVLRKIYPDHPRPFRLSAPYWIGLLGFYICNLIFYWVGWDIILKTFVVMMIGYLMLFLFRFTESGKDLDLKWSSSWWFFLYIGCMVMISYSGAFGGLNAIPFGWDFLVIAGVSWIIYQLAIRCGFKRAV